MGAACGDPGGGENPMMRLTDLSLMKSKFTKKLNLMSDTMEA